MALPTLFINILHETVRPAQHVGDRNGATGCQQFWPHLIFSFIVFSFSSFKTYVFLKSVSHIYPRAQTSHSLTRFRRPSWACGVAPFPAILEKGPLAPPHRPMAPLLNVASKFSLLEQFRFSISRLSSPSTRLLTEYSRSSFSFCF